MAPEFAVVIFFQEMGVPHMRQLQQSAWVKRRFNLTDASSRNWLSSHYGTTTLVDRRLQIDSVFRVSWHSGMGRDGLFVDISLDNRNDPDAPPRIMRLCNTHLESLAADPPVRPVQMEAARDILGQHNVSCAILAGDLNAIQPFDHKLHTENKLNDAYLEIGGKEGTPGQEDSKEGHTWGYQGRSKRFGYRRMDKILYRGSLSPIKFQRIGMGIKVAKEYREAAVLDWVSDHYGVMCDFVLSSDEQLTDPKQHGE
ncbi:tyrosyl-DNA phosphodiesterase 2 [Alternaria panax]|uniref:Tyrosyl-DNA phosphodiesterase 2 n=1 Tax=Alternaria panax TaxID=48097 RepID=A0AAD4F9A0_9PLEO|nr:tyrosyl-DNA phosphodiesterase 2 [Alternaria panax]